MPDNVIIKGKEYDREEIDSKFVSGMRGAEISDRTTDKKIYTRTKGWVKESEFKQHVFGEKNRHVNSDGFLAIANSARDCKCGGCCIASDGYVCPRCGKQA